MQDGAWSNRTNQAAPSQTNSYAQAVAASDANLVAEANRFLLQGAAVGGQVASEWDPAATRAAERQREATARFLGNWGDGRGGFGSPMGALGATIGMLSSGNVAYAAAAGETTASLDAFAPTGGARVAGGFSSIRRSGALHLEANRLAPGFNTIEIGVIQEAKNILGSAAAAQIHAAHAAGQPLSINIGGRIIQYEPGLPASGMTMFGENGFVIGREAFASRTEFQKTVLHELYRLNTSTSASGVSAGLAAQETKAAYDFAARAVRHLGGK